MFKKKKKDGGQNFEGIGFIEDLGKGQKIEFSIFGGNFKSAGQFMRKFYKPQWKRQSKKETAEVRKAQPT